MSNHPNLRAGFSRFERIHTSREWFEIYRITHRLFVLHEPRHFEATTISLLIGEDRAIVIDTGCGIGDLRPAVEQITDKPVLVIHTHTHPDHLGGTRQFDEIAVFDHPVSRRVAARGITREVLEAEILAEPLVEAPWPAGFEPEHLEVRPLEVDRWLRDGDRIELGGIELEVIHTPGEAPDHICLLDRADRILFCGDILLRGPVWTHLEGGSLADLIASYRKLMSHFDAFDHLMPGHNEPWIDKSLLPESLAGAERVAAGEIEPHVYVDPWGRRLRRYTLGRFELLTR